METPAGKGWDAARPTVPDADLRVSQTERDAAARLLGEHLAAGRIEPAEFDERCDRALAARTRGDLDRLFADLPAERPARPPAPAGPDPARRIAALIRPLAAMAVLAGLAVILALTGPAHGHSHYPWPLIPLVFIILRRPWRRNRGARPWK